MKKTNTILQHTVKKKKQIRKKMIVKIMKKRRALKRIKRKGEKKGVKIMKQKKMRLMPSDGKNTKNSTSNEIKRKVNWIL